VVFIGYILLGISACLAIALKVIPKKHIFAVDPIHLTPIWQAKLWHLPRHMLNRLGNALRDIFYISLILGIIILVIPIVF